MSIKRRFFLISIGIFVYCLIKLSLFYVPGKFGGSLAFLIELLYYFVPLLAFLTSCFVLFYPLIKHIEIRVLLFFLFYFFPAKSVIMNNSESNGLFFLDTYFDFWKFNSLNFRLEYLIMLVVASSFFIVFLFQQIQLWRKR